MRDIAELNSHYTAILTNLRELGEHYFAAGQLDRTLHVFATGDHLARDPHAPPAPVAALLIGYGHSLMWEASLRTGQYTHALEVLQRANDLAHSSGDQDLCALALDRLGLGYYQQALTGAGDFTQAHMYFQRALELREAQQDIEGFCSSRFHVGLIAEREQRYESAEATFMEVYRIAQREGFKISQSETARHLGFAQLRADNLAGALRLFQEALALVEKNQSRLFLPFAHLAVANVLHMQHDYDQARRQYDTAYALAQGMQVKRATVQILYSLGELSEDQQDMAQAHSHYKAAYAEAQAIHFISGEQRIAAKLESRARASATRDE